jgi:NAD(P)-dependent dehydrogenase (short-subunit alcohol dehydrogenase family)
MDVTPMERDVVVIIGTGGMGVACARRLGPGLQLLIADNSAASLERVVDELRRDGFVVEGRAVDVADGSDVGQLALAASELGRIAVIVHTAGVSPSMTDADTIIAVDLVGTANVIDSFEKVVGRNAVAVCVASMVGTMTRLAPDVERFLATAPTADLPMTARQLGITEPTSAYGYAKRANQLRVEAAASRWGLVGARIVSISPGIISTGMAHQELRSEIFGDLMRSMVASSPAGRIGTAEDVASVVEWLCGPGASFITGTDILMDGGVTAAQRWTSNSSDR